MLLYIIRHGDPIYSPDSLTELGKIQAASVAKRLSAHGIDKIFSSPLKRAIQTAEPTSILTKKEIMIEDWMSEHLAWQDFATENEAGIKTWSFGIEENRRKYHSREIQNRGLSWFEDPFFGENFKRGYFRLLDASDDFFERLGYVHDRENCCYRAISPNDMRVAAFCHQGFGLSWLGTLLDIPLPISWVSFDMSHSDFTVIEFKAGADGVCIPKVLTLSNDSHLYADNIPTKYNNGIFI